MRRTTTRAYRVGRRASCHVPSGATSPRAAVASPARHGPDGRHDPEGEERPCEKPQRGRRHEQRVDPEPPLDRLDHGPLVAPQLPVGQHGECHQHEVEARAPHDSRGSGPALLLHCRRHRRGAERGQGETGRAQDPGDRREHVRRPVDVRLELEPDVGERPHVVHRPQREGREPGRGQDRGDGQQGAFAQCELADLPRARTAGAEDRRLDAPALGEQAGEEEQRRAGEHCQLDGRDEHTGARDEQRPVGPPEDVAEARLHGQPGGGAAFGVQPVLEAGQPLTEAGEVVGADSGGVRLCAPARLGPVGGERREGLLRHDERPVRREAQLLAPVDLERRAPPVRIVHRDHPVYAGHLHRDRLVLVLDGGDLDHVPLREAQRPGRRLDSAASTSSPPAPAGHSPVTSSACSSSPSNDPKTVSPSAGSPSPRGSV